MAVLNEEQQMIKDGAKTWVAQKSPVSAFRKLRDSGNENGFELATWKEMVQMGWSGILIPEAWGGSELGNMSLGLILEETGRTLTASPLLSTALVGASALFLGGNENQKKEYLPKIADGNLIATLAVDEGAHHQPEHIELTAKERNGNYQLSGSKKFVLEGATAGLIVVAARTSKEASDKDGVTLFLVDGDAKGLTRQPLKTVDSRGVANLEFEDVEVSKDAILGKVDEGASLLKSILDRARIGLSAEMLGLATQAFETTLEYLKTRVQFDRAIGSFQALQHRAANMFTEIELTRSCVESALQEIDQGARDLRQSASLAKVKANELVHLVSNEMIQMHGGIGMTDEHDAGFYIKRARVQEHTFGSSAYHRERYAAVSGI